MNQLLKIFKSLSVAQRVTIGVALVVLIAGLTTFVRWRHESDFRPLFTSMAPEDAAGIVQKLKEGGVEHRLASNGTSVLVPAARVDELRLEMAAAGLPRTGRIGFELFDKTNLGVTDFTEHVNYRRALEGELERSIRVLSEVEQARVHLSFPKESVFLDAREEAKASVLLSLRAGAHLSESNVQAVTNLIASAVEGLNPESVSVVDMRGNLLSRARKLSSDPSSNGDDAALGYKHQVEKDLTAKVMTTLAPLLGDDHFRVGISADCDWTTSEVTDETFDPSRSVMTSSQKTEDLSSKPDSAGVPGTAANVPRAPTRPTVTGASLSRRTENTAYQTSRSVRLLKVPRGSLKHLSAAILIDQEMHWEGKGTAAKRVYTPPSAEKLKAIREIVAGAIGFAPARGDQLVIQSLAFDQHLENELAAPAAAQPAAGSQELQRLAKNPKTLIGVGVTVLVAVGALMFLLTRRKKKAEEPIPTAAQHAEALAEAEQAAAAERAALEERQQQELAARQGETLQLEAAAQVESLRQTVRGNIMKDPVVAAGVIRNWIAETDR